MPCARSLVEYDCCNTAQSSVRIFEFGDHHMHYTEFQVAGYGSIALLSLSCIVWKPVGF